MIQDFQIPRRRQAQRFPRPESGEQIGLLS